MSANDVQHGGDHYVGEYQHWDLVADLQLNYFQANASKYVTRHRKKNGREDVLKASHYVQKWLELVTDRRISAPTHSPPPVYGAKRALVDRFFHANGIERWGFEYHALLYIFLPTRQGDISDAMLELKELLAEYDAADPSPAYVNQG